MKKSILLTGGSGMVGSNVRDHLQANYTLYAPSHTELDLLDRQALKQYLQSHPVEMIIHTAGAVGGIHTNMKYMAQFLVENWNMGQNVVLSAREAGITKLINLGSSCMYPKEWRRPLLEEDILTGALEPTNEGYAIAKSAVARLCSYLQREDPRYHYKTIIPCNLYGKYDSFHPEKSHLIPAIIHKLHWAVKRGDQEVTIWGDGQARRESLYAGDLAQCINQTITRFETLPEILNVGVGHDRPIDEYYRAAAKVIGFHGRFRHDLSRPSGVARKLVDVSKAQQWGWEATTKIEEGIATTYEYYLTQPIAQ